MLPKIKQIAGIHPGYILERVLKERHVSKKSLATSIGEYEQVIGEITKRKRKMNPTLSLKLDRALCTPEAGYFMLLQTYYDLSKAEKELNREKVPDLSKIRRILFWDTDFDQIDWIKNKRFVIERIYSRGNKSEIEELARFYGKEEIQKILNQP